MTDETARTTPNRPKDVNGDDIQIGPWYWARNRRGQVVGTGQFLDDLRFSMGGYAYHPEIWDFHPAHLPACFQSK